jgi:hypothetical protein
VIEGFLTGFCYGSSVAISVRLASVNSRFFGCIIDINGRSLSCGSGIGAGGITASRGI